MEDTHTYTQLQGRSVKEGKCRCSLNLSPYTVDQGKVGSEEKIKRRRRIRKEKK